MGHTRTTVERDEELMEAFRKRMKATPRPTFLGGFPNFYVADYGSSGYGGTIFIRNTTPPAAKFFDVPRGSLGNVRLDDFGERMRATSVYAWRNGYVGGFPTFFHADYGNGTVCGTVVLTSTGAEWQDIYLSELGNPALDDIEGRFRGTQDWAKHHGFIGGFPNLFHADYGNGVVCGTVLLKQGFAEWQDVLLWHIN